VCVLIIAWRCICVRTFHSIFSFDQSFNVSQDAKPKFVTREPAYAAFDKKVLRFYGYFKEDVAAGNNDRYESHRVRQCIIYYYLEDGTIHITEVRSATPISCCFCLFVVVLKYVV
jgi:hypothetical protein